ncbi:uncharacterized protein MONBRDRAFT_37785 [Monosiga brevicollis MX1]|uniref:non-specific serine/threonine protein kinase n=1 Tax=Monosiga brevicollis TaxID=81824 RepID=A9V404_MONBE|nr:uncharacterized protein MONBRDRAFT_37785 [Monosiga brevicollis MX1]EDQ87800.1 predicted protein [Monosiga brevicollis MX1]|eukprot:XP_001747333.1 hypothetical protein [Monosiga brevicollis MX1]
MESRVIKEGKLLKRGEYISTWRVRWFILRDDGTFRGYKNRPMTPTDPPVNLFEIKDCTLGVTDDDKSGKFGFSIRFVQMTRIIERTFYTETLEEREGWIQAINDVKARVDESQPADMRSEYRAMSFIGGRPEAIEMDMDSFELLKVLGKGTFGKVMLARLKLNRKIYAMKVLKKSMVLEKDELAHTLTENSVLAKASHPFLTSLHFSFQTPELLCFVMEYVNGGELFYHLRKEKRFSEERVRFYASEITSALTYMHSEGIVYRDLKLENVMLSSEGHIKITDFGLAKEEIHYGDKTTTFVGTPEYLAPEVIVDSEYGRAVDWWGLGVISYEMLAGALPFNSRDYEKLFNLILTQEVTFPAHFSAEAADCISRLLDKEPSTRLGGAVNDGKDVMAHPWFHSIDWEALEAKTIDPPFVPKVRGEDDVGNFDSYFTSENPILTPEDVSFGLLSLYPHPHGPAFRRLPVVLKHSGIYMGTPISILLVNFV